MTKSTPKYYYNPSSFSYDAEADIYDTRNSGMVWNYGTEIFCSQTGRFVHIIADLRHLAKKSYDVSLCSLGIMGTKFDREVEPPSEFDIYHKSTESITVQKVAPVYDVGDKIDIRVRVLENPFFLDIKLID